MKINSGTVIIRLNGQPVMVDQETINISGVSVPTGGHEMTVGDVISNILSLKKSDKISPLKAYVLAQRFYKGGITEIDDSDFSSLREIIEKNDQYVPFVIAQVLQAMIDSKDKADRKPAH